MKHIYVFLCLFLLSGVAEAGWLWGCDEDEPDPCGECKNAEITKLRPQYKQLLENRKQQTAELQYFVDKKDAEWDALFEYASKMGDSQTMGEVLKARIELGKAELEEQIRIHNSFVSQCKKLFPNKY